MFKEGRTGEKIENKSLEFRELLERAYAAAPAKTDSELVALGYWDMAAQLRIDYASGNLEDSPDSSDELELLRAHIVREKLEPECPVCGSNRFAIGLKDVGTTDDQGTWGSVMPTISIVCRRCRHVMYGLKR